MFLQKKTKIIKKKIVFDIITFALPRAMVVMQ